MRNPPSILFLEYSLGCPAAIKVLGSPVIGRMVLSSVVVFAPHFCFQSLWCPGGLLISALTGAVWVLPEPLKGRITPERKSLLSPAYDAAVGWGAC